MKQAVDQKIYDIYLKLCALNKDAAKSDAEQLRRAALTLHRWYEHECNGIIQRDEETGKPYWHSFMTGNRLSVAADRERGAEKRIASICNRLELHYYLQGDPRGGTLYVSQQPISQDNYNRATFIA